MRGRRARDVVAGGALMDFTIEKDAFERLERVRQLGKTHIRPLGLEADRLGRPVPPDHDYFKLLLKTGLGRTRWLPPEQAAAQREAKAGESVRLALKTKSCAVTGSPLDQRASARR